jgi:hypothetical protein
VEKGQSITLNDVAGQSRPLPISDVGVDFHLSLDDKHPFVYIQALCTHTHSHLVRVVPGLTRSKGLDFNREIPHRPPTLPSNGSHVSPYLLGTDRSDNPGSNTAKAVLTTVAQAHYDVGR